MKDQGIRFSTVAKSPILGDRVACYVLAAKELAARGFFTRQGEIISIVYSKQGRKKVPVAYGIEDEISGEVVYAAPESTYVPEDYN